jgi:hypothetical protein
MKPEEETPAAPAPPDAAPAPEPAPVAAQPPLATIKLDEPIKRGQTSIERVSVRRPNPGEMEGISLRDIINLESTAALNLLPRVSAASGHHAIAAPRRVGRYGPVGLHDTGGRTLKFFVAEVGSPPAFDRIEEPMADIAAVFHWQLGVLRELSLRELCQWQQRAVSRWNLMNGDG